MPAEGGKRKILGFIVLILILTVVGSVFFYMRYRDTHIKTDDAFYLMFIFTLAVVPLVFLFRGNRKSESADAALQSVEL